MSEIAATSKVSRAADFSGDGKPDLAIATGPITQNGKITILEGNGDGTFAAGGDVNDASPFSLAAADLTGKDPRTWPLSAQCFWEISQSRQQRSNPHETPETTVGQMDLREENNKFLTIALRENLENYLYFSRFAGNNDERAVRFRLFPPP